MDRPDEYPISAVVLESLQVEHVAEMLPVLADQELYDFTGGEPPTRDALVKRYRAQVDGSGRPAEQWHNWIVRRADTGEAIGFVQATVVDGVADIAWLVGIQHQGHGFAVRAVQMMIVELESSGIARFTAHIHSEHRRSQRVASAVGFERTGVEDDDGEEVWGSRTR